MSTLEVTATGAAADAVTTHVPTLVQDRVASRIFAKDHTLWGPAAEDESAKRLNWTGLPRTSRHLIGEVAALREELSQAGYDRVVLCGMGGSSLAPEVICATAGVPIDVLDSSDPDVVRAALTDLDRTVVVVSSKSGSTVETDSQRRAFEQAFRDAGLDPTARMVIVTDPGSPLDNDARAAGFRVVNADPQVGGRYSALTAFGLVPSALAGADVETLLDDAEAVSDLLAADDDANPALRLAAAMAGTQPLRDKLVLVDDGTENVGFGAWAEQLIAESTGKDGTGILPVVAIGAAPASLYDDGTVVRLVATDSESDSDGEQDTSDAGGSASSAASLVTVAGPLGAQIMLWETATAVAGRLLGISPFDQPDVESAKAAARELLDAGIGAGVEPAFTDGSVEVTALGGDWLGDATTVDAAVDTLLGLLDDQQGYIAVMAYLDRLGDADLELVARDLFDRTGRPATFGWG
ncbi:MAG TPA: glucose-6-phosphate isomerase, partial [Ornithinibacter sp.]|nr:glucose-6-phosphate isomerase [Ornithinibacter sp.]